jgi:YfiH family protein
MNQTKPPIKRPVERPVKKPIETPIKRPATTMVRDRRGTLHLEFLPFNKLSLVNHGIFTRLGGQSDGPFASLNVGLSTGDSRDIVEKNRQLVAEAIDIGPAIYLNQIHSNKVLIFKRDIDGQDQCTAHAQSTTRHATHNTTQCNIDGQESNSKSSEFHNDNGQTADAMITNIQDLSLVIQVADCQPVLLLDPIKKVVANIHSGWKGSIKNIIGKSIDAMQDNFGSDPQTILAGIGPSLGPCCSEFINYAQEIPEHLWQYKDEKDHFDFWQISLDQLTERGLKPENITIAGICTKCAASTFFSYRYNNTTGRFASVIKLKEGRIIPSTIEKRGDQ